MLPFRNQDDINEKLALNRMTGANNNADWNHVSADA